MSLIIAHLDAKCLEKVYLLFSKYIDQSVVDKAVNQGYPRIMKRIHKFFGAILLLTAL